MLTNKQSLRIKKRISFLENKKKWLNERLFKLNNDLIKLWDSACDANCENDGNAHRSNCSIYKL